MWKGNLERKSDIAMYSIESRVRYSEVNSEKQLTLPALLDYLQDCCTFQSEDLEIGVDFLAEEQAAWVLLSWQIEILRYPQMAEKIKISTWPYDFKGFYGYRNFQIEDEAGTVIAKANSVWVFMDMAKMRPARILEQVADRYRDLLEPQLPGEWADRKMSVPTDGEKKEPVQVARFHIDTNHHMNNGKYILVAEEYLPEGFEVGSLRAEYKNAAVLGDVLYPVVCIESDAVTVVLEDGAGKIYAIVEFRSNED